MTRPSDSKFYPSDCFCLKRKTKSDVLIECQSCIEGFGKWNDDGRGCSCEYHKVNQMHCPICAADRDRLDDMHFEFDNLLLKLSSSIKSYGSGNDEIQEIIEVSKRMRQCNRDLLARLIFSHEVDDEDDYVPEEDEEDREHAIEEAREGAIEEYIDNMTD